jgi:glycine cleavage system H lipoate-binding protein
MQPTPDRTRTELPCVWVSAGVLSYRLCDREYDCEGCPLYLALRGGGAAAVAGDGAARSPDAAPGGDDPVARYLAELGAGCTLHLDRAYSAEGLWMERESSGADGELRIGMDDYTLRLLQPVDNVVLPRPGVWLQHRAPCAWVNRGRLAIALRCPVAGEVIEVDPRPALGPPASWWFRIKPHESVALAAGLYRNEALLSWFLTRVRAVHQQLDAAMAPPEGGALGPALSDGGLPTRDLEAVLGRERFEALVGALFPIQI